MIVAQRKPVAEIMALIAPYRRVLLAACGGCVTVCNAGGRREAGILAAALRAAAMAQGRELVVSEATVERQCDAEFLAPLRAPAEEAEAVLSLACGAGVQFLAERLQLKPIFPALDTTFIGVSLGEGVWSERCHACGQCLLGLTGGVCPVARCAKRLFNGPCGGSSRGKCEIGRETDCAWQLVYDRLKALNRLDLCQNFIPPKDWSRAKDGGPRTYVREDLTL